MGFGNVIPIDTEAARRLARRHVRFRWLVAALVAAWAALLVPTLLFTPLPPLGPFAALAVLVILAEHRFVLFGDETSMSASIIVIVASVFIFADTSPLAGPMLIGSLGGLYLPHLRHGNQHLALANISIFGLSAASAVSSASGIGLEAGEPTARAVAVALIVSATYWYSNSVFTGVASATRNGARILNSVRTQAVSEWPMLLLTTAAALVGIAAEQRIIRAAFALVLVLMLFEIHAGRRGAGRTPIAFSASGAVLVGISFLSIGTSPFGAALASAAAFVFVADIRFVRGRSFLKLTITLAVIASTPFIRPLGLPLGLQFITMTLAALGAIVILEVGTGHRQQRRRISLLVWLGLFAPSSTEALATCAITASLLMAGRGTGQQVAFLTVAGFAATSAHRALRPAFAMRSTVQRTSGIASR